MSVLTHCIDVEESIARTYVPGSAKDFGDLESRVRPGGGAGPKGLGARDFGKGSHGLRGLIASEGLAWGDFGILSLRS